MLNGVASRISREEILEALVEPSARIAPGFGVVTLTLKNGETLSGILAEETTNTLLLGLSKNDLKRVDKADIEERRSAPSSMPPMGTILSRREIRDLVAFLSTLEEEKG